MVEARLLGSAASYFLSAALWSYIGLLMLQRAPAKRGERAAVRFGWWWLGLAGHSFLGMALAILAAAELAEGPVVAVATYGASVFIAVMFWGLLSYLLFLYTGRSGVFPAVTTAYAIQLALLLAAVWRLKPIGAHVEGWIVIIDYAEEAGASLDAFVSLAFLLPPVFASGAYVMLLRRVKDRTHRYRVTLVGGSIFAWLVSAIAIGAIPGDIDVLHVAARLFSLAAAGAVILAYDPPAWVQRRFGVERLGHEVFIPHVESPERVEALRSRVRDLV